MEYIKNKFAGQRICLFCYEANPEQCHRYVVAQELAKTSQIKEPVIDLQAPLIPILKTSDDAAMMGDKFQKGGIDLTPQNFNIETQGQGIEFNVPMNPAQWENLNIQGFTPVIFTITPVTNLPLFLGISQKKNTVAIES